MADTTGALTPVAAPDRLDVAVTRLVARDVLHRTSAPFGQHLVTLMVDLQRKTKMLIDGVLQISARPESHHFRAAAGRIVSEAHTLLQTRPQSLTGAQDFLRNLARMIVRLCGALDLMEGGDTCPPTR